MPHQEENYFILAVGKNRLVFAITARSTDEQMPIILYDGGKHALFYRNEQETVVLDYIDSKIVPYLASGQNVVMAEINPKTEELTRQYPVSVKIVDKLPKFGLK
ncbi:MAG: hypothetical protein J6P93_01080 [Alphaproteobacteria bacterium]|nr:hypothetical protein [Alphaproteobacteria bacterium]